MWLRLLLAVSFLIGSMESNYICNLSDEVSIHKDGAVFMQHYVNDEEGTFTMRIRYTDGQSWIGVGINTSGQGKMVPAYSVIGDISRGVKRYNLQSDDKQGSGVIPLQDTNGHLKSSSFVQTDAGESILEFTHDLIIRDPDNGSIVYEITESSVWIWAVGLPNNVWEGKHKVHGAFDGFQLYSGCVRSTAKPTKKPTAPPTLTPTFTEPADPPTLTPALTEIVLGESFKNESPSKTNGTEYGTTTIDHSTIEIESESESVKSSGEEEETGLEISVKLPDDTSEPEPAKDDRIDESSTLPKEDLELGDGKGGDSNNVAQDISFLDSQSEATRDLWVAHGILLGVAWGILAPLAIGAAYLRNNLVILKKDALWLRIHFLLCVLVAFFTFAGFLVAVVATQKDDDLPHFEEDIHHKAGLAIFVLVLVQAFAGYFRPSPVPASQKLVGNAEEGDILEASENDELPQDNLADAESSLPTNKVNFHFSKALQIRKFWEYTHRLLGIILLGLAWYNCHSGIVLQAENYDQDNQESLLKIFWGITGAIVGTIFGIGYVMRLSID